MEEVKKMYEGKYADLEYYKYNSRRHIIHGDYINYIEDEDEDNGEYK